MKSIRLAQSFNSKINPTLALTKTIYHLQIKNNMKFKSSLCSLFLMISLLAFSCGNDDSDENLCENIECNNDGICIDGSCNCATGFEGPTCDIQKTVVGVKLTQVTVKNFPVTDAFGGGWDDDSKADITFQIVLGTDVLYLHSPFVENANPDDDHFFQIPDLTLIDLNSDYVIEILDDDELEGGTFDVIDSYIFSIYSESSGFPNRIELRGGSTQVDLDIDYLF